MFAVTILQIQAKNQLYYTNNNKQSDNNIQKKSLMALLHIFS